MVLFDIREYMRREMRQDGIRDEFMKSIDSICLLQPLETRAKASFQSMLVEVISSRLLNGFRKHPHNHDAFLDDYHRMFKSSPNTTPEIVSCLSKRSYEAIRNEFAPLRVAPARIDQSYIQSLIKRHDKNIMPAVLAVIEPLLAGLGTSELYEIAVDRQLQLEQEELNDRIDQAFDFGASIYSDEGSQEEINSKFAYGIHGRPSLTPSAHKPSRNAAPSNMPSSPYPRNADPHTPPQRNFSRAHASPLPARNAPITSNNQQERHQQNNEVVEDRRPSRQERQERPNVQNDDYHHYDADSPPQSHAEPSFETQMPMDSENTSKSTTGAIANRIKNRRRNGQLSHRTTEDEASHSDASVRKDSSRTEVAKSSAAAVRAQSDAAATDESDDERTLRFPGGPGSRPKPTSSAPNMSHPEPKHLDVLDMPDDDDREVYGEPPTNDHQSRERAESNFSAPVANFSAPPVAAKVSASVSRGTIRNLSSPDPVNPNHRQARMLLERFERPNGLNQDHEEPPVQSAQPARPAQPVQPRHTRQSARLPDDNLIPPPNVLTRHKRRGNALAEVEDEEPRQRRRQEQEQEATNWQPIVDDEPPPPPPNTRPAIRRINIDPRPNFTPERALLQRQANMKLADRAEFGRAHNLRAYSEEPFDDDPPLVPSVSSGYSRRTFRGTQDKAIINQFLKSGSRWELMKDTHPEIFEGYTAASLKDRWRVLEKHGWVPATARYKGLFEPYLT